MKIIDLLKERVAIFAVDEIETKKMQNLVNAVNKNFLEMADAIQNFSEYKKSQLKGELHTRIVMVKSLIEEYPDWQAVKDAYYAEELKQKTKIAEFNNQKSKLINSLISLLNESKNSPVVSLYDLFDQDYQLCEQGHEVIVLGKHNNRIIEHAIEVLEETLVANGNFDLISGITLQANYSTVNQNAEICSGKLIGGTIKAAKVNKLRQSIDQMVEIAKRVVLFVTYKKSLEEIGVKPKELQNKEKAYTKQYIPIKKLLQKELGVKFADICDVVVNEEAFATPKVD